MNNVYYVRWGLLLEFVYTIPFPIKMGFNFFPVLVLHKHALAWSSELVRSFAVFGFLIYFFHFLL